MSRFTDYGENKIIDFFRGQGLTLPATWYIGALSASGDPSASLTELTWTGYARVPMPRNTDTWAGTQGAGTTVASTGSSHTTTNNIDIDFGVPGSTPGTTMRAIGLFDAAAGGNCWTTAQLTVFLTVTNGVPIVIGAGLASFALGATGGMSDHLSNKLIDKIWRGQGYDWPAYAYAALLAGSPGNGNVQGLEIGVSRPAIASSLTAWSGTQGAGTTLASTGTAGEMSNNNALVFSTPEFEWGTATHGALYDESTTGNLLFWGELGQAGTVRAYSSAPAYAAGTLKVKVA